MPPSTRSADTSEPAALPKAECGSRALFPTLSAQAYLNHAAISPVCLPVEHAVRAALSDYAAHGAGAFPRWEARRRELRAEFAALIGAAEDEVALAWNTSRGITDIALSIPWKPQDRVIVFDGEFPANVTPWQCAAETYDLELVFQRAEDFQTDEGLAKLEAELRRGARLVAVSAVQFQSGLRMPLATIAKLCHDAGAELCVDAIQACGVLPIDVTSERIDYLATGGHKWLLGSEGAGFLFVERTRARALKPPTAGWLSHEDPIGFLLHGAGLLRYDRPFRSDARVFETGTSNLLGLAALGASVPLLRGLGLSTIYEHVSGYLDSLESGLTARGFVSLRSQDPARRSSILSVTPPEGIELSALAAALRRRGVMPGTPDGKLRFAPHFANAHAEVLIVLGALDEALAELRA